MNSKETFENILKRSKYVMSCGNTRNNRYSEYLNASLSYDNLKKGFYIALKLSRHDEDVPEEQLQRYEHLVKHFDQQLLNQFIERDYAIQKIQNESDIPKDSFHDRITKIETEGVFRNRIYFEFIDAKEEFDEAKKLFYNENSLALRDGLITDTDKKIQNDSMKMIEKNFDEGMTQIRQNYNQKRKHGQSDRGRGRQGRVQDNNEQEHVRIEATINVDNDEQKHELVSSNSDPDPAIIEKIHKQLVKLPNASGASIIKKSHNDYRIQCNRCHKPIKVIGQARGKNQKINWTTQTFARHLAKHIKKQKV